MTFSEKAKPLKTKGNYTLRELADACNSTESSVSRYINGQIDPPDDIAANLLKYMGDIPSEDGQEIKEKEDEDMQAAIQILREAYGARMEDVLHRIADLKTQIADLKAQVVHEKREKWIFIVLLAIVVIFVFGLFYVDISNGAIGWFRH